MGADADENVRAVRRLIRQEIDVLSAGPGQRRLEVTMKRELFKLASQADLVLDLHCDHDAVLHTYTHDRLWPALSDLSIELGSRVNLLSPDSGGNCFDEACSCPWAALADAFPGVPLPMACQSATVELRGESDVSDELALQDAHGLFRMLEKRGYVTSTSTTTKDDSSSGSRSESSSSSR